MVKKSLVKEICPTTTQEWIKNGALLIDVREKHEVDELAFDAPNIINIPLSEFEERFNEIPKDKEVIMVCRSGGRSLRATGFLVNHGYDKVVNMQHGIIRWVKKSFPTIGDISSVIDKKQENSCCETTESKETASYCNSSPKQNEQKCC